MAAKKKLEESSPTVETKETEKVAVPEESTVEASSASLPMKEAKAEKPKPRPKKYEQVGGYWLGYSKDGKLLSRSKDLATVQAAVTQFGGWDS